MLSGCTRDSGNSNDMMNMTWKQDYVVVCRAKSFSRLEAVLGESLKS